MSDFFSKNGWVVTLIMNLVLFAYFVGGIRADVRTMSDRLSRIERIMDNDRNR